MHVSEVSRFAESMPQGALDAVKFEEMPPNFQAAVIQGVEKGVEMMTQVVDIAELDNGALRAGSKSVTVDAVRKAQKVLADSVRKWGNGILDALQPADPEREILFAVEAVYTLTQAFKPKLLTSFLETMTSGSMADIFAVQGFVIKSIRQFASDNQLSPGIDAKTPVIRFSMLRHFLFEAACRHARRKKGLSVDRLIKQHAQSMLHSNYRDSLGSLLRLYLCGLLENMPNPSELKVRGNVKDFNADGLHAYFIRDCITKRCSFEIEAQGKLKNAHDREQEVARGKRELEFFEKRLAEAESQPEQERAGDPSTWKRPEVRSSASMTKEDLETACDTFIRAVPDLPRRLSVSMIANLDSLDLPALFFGKDPAAGILLDGTQRHMEMSFSPTELSLSISAMLFHDRLRAVERTGDFESEVELHKSSFTQLDYTVFLRQQVYQDGKHAPFWRVNKVRVDIVAPYLVALRSASANEKETAKRNIKST